MPFKINREIFLLVLAFVVTIGAYIWFTRSEYFAGFNSWAQQHLTLFLGLLLLIKITGIIWPPLPGGVFTVGSIAIIGWPTAYAIDAIGSLIGATIAFFLGRKYGYPFLNRIIGEEATDKLHQLKIVKHREVEAVFALRLLSGGVLFEAVCYGAGLIGVHYPNFLLGSILFHTTVGIPSYYLANNLFSGKNIPLTLLIGVIAVTGVYLMRTRYFVLSHSIKETTENN